MNAKKMLKVDLDEIIFFKNSNIQNVVNRFLHTSFSTLCPFRNRVNGDSPDHNLRPDHHLSSSLKDESADKIKFLEETRTLSVINYLYAMIKLFRSKSNKSAG